MNDILAELCPDTVEMIESIEEALKEDNPLNKSSIWDNAGLLTCSKVKGGYLFYFMSDDRSTFCVDTSKNLIAMVPQNVDPPLDIDEDLSSKLNEIGKQMVPPFWAK